MTRARGRTTLLWIGALVAAWSAMTPAPVAGAPRTFEGVLRVLAADTVDRSLDPVTFRGRSQDVYRLVLDAGDRAYFIRGARGKANTRVKVTGELAGNTITATNVSATASVAGIPTTGTTRVLVLLAYWTAPDHVTRESAAQQMFADSSGWYREASYSALGQAGDVTPWLRIPAPASGCYADHLRLMADAKAAAQAEGYALESYDNFVVYFPRCSGDAEGYAGWAYVGARNSWLNGYIDRRVTVHEEGHNYGLRHSHSYMCSQGGSDGSCSFSDYGDPFDAMGSSGYVGHFGASQKSLLAWMSGRNVDLSAGGTTTLAPLAEQPLRAGAAFISRATGRTYWLEYRRQIGFDSGLPASGTDGVLVHVTGPGSGSPDTGASLIDVRPGDGISQHSSTLRAGESWRSTDGVTIAVGAVSTLGATVSVDVGVKAPDAPTGFTVTRNDAARTATILWSPPAADGGAPVTGYRVARNGTDASGSGPWSTTVGSTARSHTFSDLAPGVPYTLSVQAVNAAGIGPAASGTVTVGLPSAPTALTASRNDGARTATITWAPPASDGGSPITGYRVARNGTDAWGTGPWSTTLASSARSQTFSALVPGATYTLSVQAVTARGTGAAASATVTMAVSATAPGIPGSLVVTRNDGARTATISWTPPASDGGSPITGYRVARDGTDASGTGPWSGTTSASARSHTFSNLVLGRPYKLSVQAVNARGTGAAASGTVTLGVASAPTSFKISRSDSARTATITWMPPVSDGGSPITGYRVARDGTDASGTGPWSTSLAATARSHTFGNLVRGTLYTLSVSAGNARGSGPAATGTVALATALAAVPSADSFWWAQRDPV